MNALLWKDLTSVKLTLAIMFVFAAIYSYWMGKGSLLSYFFGPAMASTVVGTSLTLDDKGWMKFAVSSGIKRCTIYRSKLVLSLIATVIGLISGFVAVGLFSIDGEVSIEMLDLGIILLFGFAFGMFVSTAVIYGCYRFNPSYCGLFVAVIVGFSAGLLVSADEILSDLISDTVYMFLVLAGIFAVMSALFAYMGWTLFKNRDF